MSLGKSKKMNKRIASNNNNPIARWGKCKWKITADRINTLSEIEMSDEYDLDEKWREPVEVRFSFPLYKDFFQSIDIQKQINNWRKRIGKKHKLYVGNRAFGINKKYRLVGVDVTNVEQIRGVVVHCDVELTFNEVRMTASQKADKRKKKKTSKSSSKSKSKKK